ncbi:LysR family transcriptional regulator [Cupriavidus pinatubonensis]|nr:LysR family transcriptional regulator [Cupriavidus pinatubonensis]
MSQLDPLSLELFIHVVEHGTIAAAAEREHISAAAVSKRLSDLEAQLQTQLLVRTNKGVEPTPAGQALLTLARSALHELDQVLVQMQSFAVGVRGLVRICSSLSAILQFLAEPLHSFSARYPTVQLQLEEKTSTLVPKAVAENAADIGIYLPVMPVPGLQTFPFRKDRLVVVTPHGHVLGNRPHVALRDLLEHELVSMHTGSAIDVALLRAAQDLHCPLKLRIRVTSFDALCVMVSAGLGIGILPEAIAQRNCATMPLCIVPLSDALASREFLLAVRSMDALPVASQMLVRHLLETEHGTEGV